MPVVRHVSVAAQDDSSSCRGQCGRHGFCRADTCICTALYEGPKCQEPKAYVVLPRHSNNSALNGHVLYGSELYDVSLTQAVTIGNKALKIRL
eukprot:scaffold111885_cov18-Prasinocladus_malaysianus.AAC.1